MTWQPIETAPKDGTRILCYFPDEFAMHNNLFAEERKKMNQEMFKILTVAWNYYGWELDPDGSTEFRYTIEGKPTHWMPLPEAPKKEGK